MKKRLFSIGVLVLVLVLALFAFTACNSFDTEVGAELLTNGDFESWNETDSVFNNWSWSSGWTNSSYSRQPITNADKLNEDYKDVLGTQYLKVSNTSGAYVYLYQSVKVDRKAVYKFSVNVKLDSDIQKGSNDTFKGAYVTFLENTEYFFVEETKADGWKTQTFYVKPMNTDYLTVCLSLGAENATCKGTVYFDNASMQRVDSVPEGATVYEFKKNTIARYSVNVSGVCFVVLLALFSVVAAGCAYVLIRRTYAKSHALSDFGVTTQVSVKGKKATTLKHTSGKWYHNVWFIAAMLALGTFVVRLIFLLAMYGFGSEMNYLTNLAALMGKGGAVQTAYANYATTLASTSPGSLYILAILGAMGANLDSAGMSVLIRMVGVLADIATVLMIYFYGRKYVGNRLSTIYAGLYALLPITFVMSALNGTFDSLLVALMFAAVILVVEKQYLPTYLVMVLAVILDLRAMAIAPILLAYMGYMYYKDADSLKKFTKNRAMIVFGLIGALVLTYILTLPVAINEISNGQPFYNFTILANMMLNKTYFVGNALNLYGMVGMNAKTTTSTVNILNLLFILVLEIFVVSLYFKNRNKQEILLLASFTLAVIAVFTLKVDFTYLFLAIALGFAYTMISGDKRMYGVMSMYSLLAFLCVGQIMNNSGYVASNCNGYIVNFETTSPDFIIFSVLAVLTTLYYVYVTYSITNNGKIVDIKAMPLKFSATLKNAWSRIGSSIKRPKEAK